MNENDFNYDIGYVKYLRKRILCMSIIFLVIMTITSLYNKELNYILMAFYMGYILSVIQDYDILHCIRKLLIRIYRRRKLYIKLKGRKSK